MSSGRPVPESEPPANAEPHASGPVPQTDASRAPAGRVGRYQRRICALLFCATAIGLIDRNPGFFVDEGVLVVGTRAMASLAVNFLSAEPK